MQKNVASQKLIVFVFDSTTNLPKTGDAANLTAYVSKDYGSVTVLGDTSATEMDSTNAKGYYLFDLTQGETNADTLLFSCKSSTANMVAVGSPATVFTTAPNFSLLSINASGKVSPADGSIALATFASDVGNLSMRSSTATGGAATTITLDAGASAVDDFYNNTLIYITGGTGVGQSRYIVDYVGSTKVATVSTWATTPDNTSTFAILPQGIMPVVTTVTNLTNAALTSAGNNAVADALLDRADAVETGITPRGALRLSVAADAGKTNGMTLAGTAHLRDVADTKNRVTATVDGLGNRTATSVDVT